MRSNCSLYVDAGYLLASAATRVTGTSLRNGIHVEFGKLIDSLIAQAEEICDLSVLRVHWYDSAKDGVPDPQQERIGELSKVKLRLGRFGVDGQQKGVDLRIGLDLVTHARHGAADVFFLVSGDDDLTEAVEEAQVHGVQVVVLAVPSTDGKAHGVSRHLVRAADQVVLVREESIDGTVLKVEAPAVTTAAQPAPAMAAPSARSVAPSPMDLAGKGRPAAAAPSAVLAYSGTTGGSSQVQPGYEALDEYDEQIDSVVRKVLDSFRKSAAPQELQAISLSRPSIPRDIDRALLLDLCDALGIYDLRDAIRFRLRDHFWEVWEESA